MEDILLRPFAFALLGLVPGLALAAVPIDSLQNGMTATVAGTVERITDEDEFRLTDASGSITVYIGPQIVPFDVGETVTVEGIVDRDGLGLELYAREAVRADGSVLQFSHSYE